MLYENVWEHLLLQLEPCQHVPAKTCINLLAVREMELPLLPCTAWFMVCLLTCFCMCHRSGASHHMAILTLNMAFPTEVFHRGSRNQPHSAAVPARSCWRQSGRRTGLSGFVHKSFTSIMTSIISDFHPIISWDLEYHLWARIWISGLHIRSDLGILQPSSGQRIMHYWYYCMGVFVVQVAHFASKKSDVSSNWMRKTSGFHHYCTSLSIDHMITTVSIPHISLCSRWQSFLTLECGELCAKPLCQRAFSHGPPEHVYGRWIGSISFTRVKAC